MSLLQSVIEQSLLFFPLICAIYISYVIMKITDLSIDSTMVLGSAITAKLLLADVDPIITTVIVMFSGFISGVCVGFIQYKNSINDIIAGLLMSFILYSINLNIMGKPHLIIMHTDNLIKLADNSKLIVLIISSVSIASFCLLMMNSKFGLKLRGFGENKNLMKKLGFNPENYRFLGLGMSGCIAAVCGSITSQIYGYTDINMGVGMAITTIGSLVIGIHLISKIKFFNIKLSDHNTATELFGCFLGIFCYFGISNALILFEINPINFKLIFALIIICSLKLTKKSGIAK
jgi:putative ABC transport system permease protein